MTICIQPADIVFIFMLVVLGLILVSMVSIDDDL